MEKDKNFCINKMYANNGSGVFAFRGVSGMIIGKNVPRIFLFCKTHNKWKIISVC